MRGDRIDMALRLVEGAAGVALLAFGVAFAFAKSTGPTDVSWLPIGAYQAVGAVVCLVIGVTFVAAAVRGA